MCFSPTVPGDASRFPNTAAPTCTPVDDSTLRYAIVLAIIFVWSDFKILYIKSEFGCFLKEENPDTSVSFLGMGGPADTRNSGSRAPVRVRATGGSAADNRKWCNFLLPAGWPSRGETAGECAGYVVLRSRVLGSWPRAGDGAARRRPRAAALLALRVQRRVRPRSRSPSRALLTPSGVRWASVSGWLVLSAHHLGLGAAGRWAVRPQVGTEARPPLRGSFPEGPSGSDGQCSV